MLLLAIQRKGGLIMASRSRQPYGFFGLFWRLALAGMLVLGLSAAGGYVAVQQIVRAPEGLAPDLLTMPLAEAVEQSSDEGFALRLEKREASEVFEPGQIVSQRPTPGSLAKMGSTIHVTIAIRP